MTNPMFKAIDEVADELRRLEAYEPNLFPLRRKLQSSQNEYLKQGDRIPITKVFVLSCTECDETQVNEEGYYLHLRKQHLMEDQEASMRAHEPRMEFESGLNDLSRLLTEYTETMLEEKPYGTKA